MGILEGLAGDSKDFSSWQQKVSKSLNLKIDETLWLSDRTIYGFFHREASDFKPFERLSSCLSGDTGVW